MKETFLQVLYQHETLYHIEESALPVTVVAPQMPEAEIEVVPEVEAKSQSVENQPIVEPPITAPAMPVLNHKVLILINEEPAQFETDQILLNKILGAVNLNLEGVDLLNMYGSQQLDFRAALNTRKVHHFISFGVPFLEVNLNIMMNVYDPKIIKGINFLFADRLSVIAADSGRKKQLWNSLKTVFVEK